MDLLGPVAGSARSGPNPAGRAGGIEARDASPPPRGRPSHEKSPGKFLVSYIILFIIYRDHYFFKKGIFAWPSPRAPRAAREPPAGPTDFRRPAARLKQASDLIRLRVLLLLGDGERSVGALRAEIACSMTALSRHLALLRLAGLVMPRRDAQRNVYALTDAGRDLRRVVAGVVG